MTGTADGSRLLVVGTGAPAVSGFPDAVLRLGVRYPSSPVRIVLTPQALRFVTPTTVRIVTGRDHFLDTWSGEAVHGAPHVEIAHWADAVVVHPATLHFVGRLAQGLADTPLLLALQCTTVPIVIAPSLPPGAADSSAYRRHLTVLAERPEVVVVPPVRGRSMSTGEVNVGAPAGFDDVLDQLDQVFRSAGAVRDSAAAGAAAGR